MSERYGKVPKTALVVLLLHVGFGIVLYNLIKQGHSLGLERTGRHVRSLRALQLKYDEGARSRRL